VLTLEQPAPEDWPAIGALADAAVAHIAGAPAQSEWLDNRKAYPGLRRHVIARTNGHPVGYGAIEQRNDSHRLFLVVPWTEPGAAAIADALVAALRRECIGVGPVWMLEYADDKPFLTYLQDRGFAVVGGFEHEGRPVMRLACANFC